MITRMTGQLNRVLDDEVRLQVGPIEYQILIPEHARRQLQTRAGEEVTLHTLHYLEGGQNASRLFPRLIGFVTEDDLGFFELLSGVDRFGVKKALKAMHRPTTEIASAIQRQDGKWLSTLPGVGRASGESIINALKKHVARYTEPVKRPDGTPAPQADGNVIDDGYQALLGLGLSPVDARDRLDRIVNSGEEVRSVEDVINMAFRLK